MTPSASPTRRLVLTAAGALLVPQAGRAQPAKRRRIAFLVGGSRSSGAPFLGAFRQGLRALGYGDENIAIEERYADGYSEHLPDLAAELVRLVPEIIVAGSTTAIQAAKQATSTIPIVMVAPADPVGAGFVASLAHPSGNVTGLSTSISFEIAGKSLQLLKTATPDAKRIAILVNPGYPGSPLLLRATQQAAATLGVELLIVDARTPDDIDGAFTMMMREHADALIIPVDALFLSEMSRIVALVASHKLPAICGLREFVPKGGLMSYGIDLSDNFRRAATYVDKILKGAKPTDLPVEQPTKFQLVVNLKTANALGLTIPPAILAGADEVLE
jgi:putative ABC transport system substrate-binding protein